MFRTVPFLRVIGEPVTQLLKAAAILVVALTLDRLMKAGLKIYNSFSISVPTH